MSQPTQDEEGGLDVVAIQELENPVRVGDGPAFKVLPPIAVNVLLESGYLEVVLDVNGEGV